MTGVPPRLPPPLPNTAMSGGLPEGLGGWVVAVGNLRRGSGDFRVFFGGPRDFGRMNSSYKKLWLCQNSNWVVATQIFSGIFTRCLGEINPI